MSAALVPLPGRLATYRVTVCDDLTLGFIRLDVPRGWIARTLGAPDGSTAASIRSFSEKAAAIQWLQECKPAPGSGKQRRET
jgi:hypothetical protein